MILYAWAMHYSYILSGFSSTRFNPSFQQTIHTFIDLYMHTLSSIICSHFITGNTIGSSGTRRYTYWPIGHSEHGRRVCNGAKSEHGLLRGGA